MMYISTGISRNIILILTTLCFLLYANHLEAFTIETWTRSWHSGQVYEREKLLIDFLEYALEPIAPTRVEALKRLRVLQNIMRTTKWTDDDTEMQRALEKIVNNEVILVNAAIEMNLPQWCGTVPSKYLTGDNIAFLCSHRTFKVNGYSSFFVPFDPRQVKTGDSVFVVTNYLDLFFDVYHREIPHPYILVTNNSDFPVPGKFAHFLDDEKILAWHAINLDETHHHKLHPVPLGIRNHGYGREPINFMDSVLSSCKSLPKKILLYINFTLNHQDRRDAIAVLKNKRWCATILTKKDQREYYKDVAQSKFVLSPRGDGLDCWRTWETLLLGSYPVVKSSPLDPLYAEFPIVIVNNWSELTEQLLEDKYRELSSKMYDYDKLFASYWGKRINS